MNELVYPQMRKWISKPLHMGQTTQGLREQYHKLLEEFTVPSQGQEEQPGPSSQFLKLTQGTLTQVKIKCEPGLEPQENSDSNEVPYYGFGARTILKRQKEGQRVKVKSEQRKLMDSSTSTSTSSSVALTDDKAGELISSILSSDFNTFFNITKKGIMRIPKKRGRRPKKPRVEEESGEEEENLDNEMNDINVNNVSGMEIATINSTVQKMDLDDTLDSELNEFVDYMQEEYWKDLIRFEEEGEKDVELGEEELELEDWRETLQFNMRKMGVMDSDEEDEEMPNTFFEEEVRQFDNSALDLDELNAEEKERQKEGQGQNNEGQGQASQGPNLNPAAPQAPPELLRIHGPATSRDSGETKFVAFMDRAFAEKTKRERNIGEKCKEELMKRMGISQERFCELKAVTSPALTSVLGESFVEEGVVEGSIMPVLAPPIPEPDKIQLKSLAVYLTHNRNPIGLIWRSTNVQQQINDDVINVAFQKRMQQQKQDYDLRKPGLVDKDKDFLIQVSVYQGGDPSQSLPSDVKIVTEPKLAYRLELLGSNTVLDLRSALKCENDLLPLTDINHPDDIDQEGREQLAQDASPDSMLMINNMIYTDNKTEGGIDFQPQINEWVKLNPKKNLGQFKSGELSTKLKDLTIQLGYPYVFIHLGKCEHILVFNKFRLLQDKDEHRLSHYPRVATIPNLKNIYCRVDHENMASWAVMGFDQFPEDPMLVCTNCVKLFCFMDDGTRRGKFQLRRFRQLANEV